METRITILNHKLAVSEKALESLVMRFSTAEDDCISTRGCKLESKCGGKECIKFVLGQLKQIAEKELSEIENETIKFI